MIAFAKADLPIDVEQPAAAVPVEGIEAVAALLLELVEPIEQQPKYEVMA